MVPAQRRDFIFNNFKTEQVLIGMKKKILKAISNTIRQKWWNCCMNCGLSNGFWPHFWQLEESSVKSRIASIHGN